MCSGRPGEPETANQMQRHATSSPNLALTLVVLAHLFFRNAGQEVTTYRSYLAALGCLPESFYLTTYQPSMLVSSIR
jgi:hypothetical protein